MRFNNALFYYKNITKIACFVKNITKIVYFVKNITKIVYFAKNILLKIQPLTRQLPIAKN